MGYVWLNQFIGLLDKIDDSVQFQNFARKENTKGHPSHWWKSQKICGIACQLIRSLRGTYLDSLNYQSSVEALSPWFKLAKCSELGWFRRDFLPKKNHPSENKEHWPCQCGQSVADQDCSSLRPHPWQPSTPPFAEKKCPAEKAGCC